MKLNTFKQEVAAIYDHRQDTYDTGKSGKWHYDLACQKDIQQAKEYWHDYKRRSNERN